MEQMSLKKPQIILLDVYETLLDMTEVERKINYLMDSKRGYAVWFELFLQYCFVDNCTSQFNDFLSIAKATMQLAAADFGRHANENEIDNIIQLLKQLPVHEDVQESLSQLTDLDYRIAALTNAPEKIVCERMERTGLISYFELVLSAEHVKKYKPCIETYQWAAKRLNVNAEEIVLASSHSWDLLGAINAGMQTAFIKRTNKTLYSLVPKPNYTCQTLADLANQLTPMAKTN